MIGKVKLTIGILTTLAVGLIGCGQKQVLPPEIPEGKTVIIAPFDSEDKSREMMMLLPYTIGTQLSLKVDSVKWIYDESEAVSPVGSYLKENNITPQDLFNSPELAAKVAKALGADFILVGYVNKPRLGKKEENRPVFDKTKPGGRGADRYFLLYQRGTIDLTLHLIDAETAKPVWSTKLKGAVKYVRAFQSGTPDRSPVPDSKIVADLRKHLAKRALHALYPSIFEDRPIPELLEKPKQKFITSGGILTFE